MRNIFFVAIVFTGSVAYSQDLYPLHPLNAEKSYSKNGYYYPEHNINIVNGTDVIIDGEKVNQFSLSNYYYYVYEIFENNDKEKFLIVSALRRFLKPGGMANFSNVKRDLAYVICLNKDYTTYYFDFKDNAITTKRSYDYYGGGTIISSINQDLKIMTLISKEKNEEKEIQINLFEPHINTSK